THLVDHLLNAPWHARLSRRQLELPGAIDIGETLADEVDQACVDTVDLGPHLLHVLAILGLARRHDLNPLTRSFGNDRIGLDLDQPFRPDEGSHLKHAVGRANAGKKLAMHAAYSLPMSYIGEIDARAHHVLEACSRMRQSLLDYFDDGAGLRRGIADGDRFAA